MDDLISRQAAIDDIKAIYEYHDTVTEDRIIDHLKRLPSAEPEIIRCKDCKWVNDCVNGNAFKIWGMEDYCSYGEKNGQ